MKAIEIKKVNSIKEENNMKAIEINNVGSVKEEKTMMSFAEFKAARCAACGWNRVDDDDKCDAGYSCEGVLEDYLVYQGENVAKAIEEEEKNTESFDELVAAVCTRCGCDNPMHECIDCPLYKKVQTHIMEKESMKSYLERLYRDEPEKAAVLSRIRWTPAGDIVHTLYNESELVYLYNKYLAYARFYEHKLDLLNKGMIKCDYKDQVIADCKGCIADWSKETKSMFFASNKWRLKVPKGSEEKKKELIEECIIQNEKLLKHYLTKEEIEILEIDKMNPIKEEKKMNFIKEEKKMKTYAELKAEKAKKREAKIEKILAKGTEVYKYPIAVKNDSREQEPVRLKDLRFQYNLSYKAENKSEFNRMLYRLKHGAALVDDANNVIYQNDEGYYAVMLTTARRYRSAAQHLIPKNTNQHDAVGNLVDYCNSMNTYCTSKFMHDIYSIVCGVGLVHYTDEGFGSRKVLYEASKEYTLDDTLLLRDFDVCAPRVSIFNGYLVNKTKFVEPTICCSEVDEDSYNKGYYTSAISTANYRTYAPKDERLSYHAEKNLELGWSERETERQADYDDYLDHSEMGMFDKGITHELADAWREFAATLSDENKEFFGINDNPQGMTEYDPEQEGFAFPYTGHETALTEALDDYEEAVKFNNALRSAIVKPNF